MIVRYRSLLAAAVLIVGLVVAGRTSALAQVSLPTAPGAHKAVEGGMTSAPASLPGTGASPLEPYLIVWLLPIAGIVCAVIATAIDRRLRATFGDR